MIKLAQKDRRVSRSLLQMDVDDHIINLKNGAYDLNQRQLLEDRASRFLTKQARVHFKNEATCDRWLKFLFEVSDDDLDMVSRVLSSGDEMEGPQQSSRRNPLFGPRIEGSEVDFWV